MTSKSIVLKNRGLSYIKRIFKSSQAPTYVSLFFTRKCNLNCSYCKASKNITTQDISIEKWKYIIDLLNDLGCRHITIYGGEPTIRSDLPEMIKHCTKKGILTHVVSNGIAINEEMLKEYVKNGYFILGISIDNFSATKSSQKIYRSEFIDLLSEIKKRYPSKIDLCFNIIITRENLNQLLLLIKKLNKKIDCAFSIDPVHSSLSPNQQYLYRNYCPNLLLKKEEMNALVNLIFRLKRQNVEIWGTKRYYHYMDKWYNKRYFWNCDAGDYYYSIDNDGKMMLCEEIRTKLSILDFLKLPSKKRIKEIRKYKYNYCDCFKPGYWIPSDLIKHPISSFLYRFKFNK
ncbi:MAG: radical SAM protein [Candidatus Helarchaeota archaeon]|nr:radical SAM protein [Candidatus Helarchaeota archaeon]